MLNSESTARARVARFALVAAVFLVVTFLILWSSRSFGIHSPIFLAGIGEDSEGLQENYTTEERRRNYTAAGHRYLLELYKAASAGSNVSIAEASGYGLPKQAISDASDQACVEECQFLFFPRSDCTTAFKPSQTTQAGLGHILTELLFFMRLAKNEERCFMFKAISAFPTGDHKDDYIWIDEVFGLKDGLLSHGAVLDTQDWDLPLGPERNYTQCDDGDCFKSKSMSLVVEEARPCFRCISQKYGKVRVKQKPMPDHMSEPIDIVWHVRIGDRVLHPPNDMFFKNVWDTLGAALTANHIQVRNRVVWAMQEDSPAMLKLAREYKRTLSVILPNADFILMPSMETVLLLMNSDIIVGSGSSFPLVAMMFADGPLYLNHEPKHGFTYGQDYIEDGLWLGRDGVIGLPPFPLELLLANRFVPANRKSKTKPLYYVDLESDE